MGLTSSKSLNQVVGVSRMRASSVISHWGKKGPQAHSAAAPRRTPNAIRIAIRPARTSFSRQLNLDLRSRGEAQPGDGPALARPQETGPGAFQPDLAVSRRRQPVYGQAVRGDGGFAAPADADRRGPGSGGLAGVLQIDLHQ